MNSKAVVHFFSCLWPRNSFLRVSLFFLGAVLFLELSLRFAGFAYNLQHRLPVDRHGIYRIFCVGESTTWGIGASDPVSKGYPHQLEAMLNERYPDKKIQCFFENTIGQNTSENLLKLPRYIKKYRPNLVIFMIGANNWWNLDSSNVLLFSDGSLSHYYWKMLIFLDQFRTWKLLKNIAFSCGLYKERCEYFFPDGRRDELMFPSKFRRPVIFDRIAVHDQEEMVKICLEERIHVILCSYPVDDRRGLFFNARPEIAQKYMISYVDNDFVFSHLTNRQGVLSRDNWHPNDKGYAILAMNIYKAIVLHGLVERAPVQ